MIPHSPHDDAWGVTRVPIAVVANGVGPTVIIEGGNHGDEYEGPIAICDLIRELDPGRVQGRLILMPATNVHAVIAGTRTSSVDGLNLNRTFPGDAQGLVTQQISDYITRVIFPIGNVFLDLHSGGSSLDILPSAIIEPARDAGLHQRNIAVARAFDAPLIVVISNYGDSRTATAAACAAGLTTMGTEMGGGGTVRPEVLTLCRRGIHNVLASLGVVESQMSSIESKPDAPLYELPGKRAFVYATGDGIFEPYHANGTSVREGQEAGRIHCTWDPARELETLYYQADGIVYGRRQPGRVRPGNCCLAVAAPYDGGLA
ncbi:MAG: succinylglutamate desuccinylase/aspartoacylase family protein [Aestuariivirga sp.]